VGHSHQTIRDSLSSPHYRQSGDPRIVDPAAERGALISNEESLPNPFPPMQHPPMTDRTFAALGWLNRAAQAVGGTRFTESIKRARFYLEKAAGQAVTPAEVAVITGLTSSLQGLIHANANARALLEESLSDFEAALEAGEVKK